MGRIQENLGKVAEAYYQAPLTTKAAIVGVVAGTFATVTQGDQCFKAWSSTFWTTAAALTAAACAGPKVRQYLFPEQKPADSSKSVTQEQEMTACPSTPK